MLHGVEQQSGERPPDRRAAVPRTFGGSEIEKRLCCSGTCEGPDPGSVRLGTDQWLQTRGDHASRGLQLRKPCMLRCALQGSRQSEQSDSACGKRENRAE